MSRLYPIAFFLTCALGAAYFNGTNQDTDNEAVTAVGRVLVETIKGCIP